MGHSRAVMPFVMGDEAVHERVTLDDARILLNSPPDARAVSVPSVAAHVQVYDRAELGSPHLPFERWTPAVPLDIGYSLDIALPLARRDEPAPNQNARRLRDGRNFPFPGYLLILNSSLLIHN